MKETSVYQEGRKLGSVMLPDTVTDGQVFETDSYGKVVVGLTLKKSSGGSQLVVCQVVGASQVKTKSKSKSKSNRKRK